MDLTDLVAERVKILHQGAWEKKQVKMVIRKRSKRVTKEVAKFAKDRFLARKAKNPGLFDGNILCLDLENSTVGPDLLVAVIGGSIKYSVFDAIRQDNIEKYGWKNFPIGTGMSVACISSDLKILMHRTKPHVDFPNKIGVIGGVYDEKTPFEVMRKELKEEAAIKEVEIKEMLLLGISSRIEERLNREFNFFARVFLTSNKIIERAKTAKDQEGEVFFLDCSPEILREFLKENHKKITSCSFSTLVLAGRYLWGNKWSVISE